MNFTRWVRLGFTIAILVLVCGLVCWNWDQISKAFELPVSVIATACFLALFNLVISAQQVRLCFPEKTKVSISAWKWFQYYVAGRLANTVLAESGTVYRAFQLKMLHSVQMHEYLAATGFASWINILLVSALSIPIMQFSPLLTGQDKDSAQIILAAFFVVVLLTPVQLSRFVFAEKDGLKAKNRIVIFSQKLVTVFEGLRSKHSVLALIISLGLLGLLGNTLLIFSVGQAVLGHFNVAAAVVVALIMKLSMLVSVTPGNIGIRESMVEAALLVVGSHSVPGSGMLLSIVLRAIGLIVVVPIGGGFLLLENRVRKNSK